MCHFLRRLFGPESGCCTRKNRALQVSISTSRTLENNPDDAQAHMDRGTAYKVLGEHEAALADFDAALRLNQTRP
jgi:regulator of sirC expression with transglutaminase-like and TPR domain